MSGNQNTAENNQESVTPDIVTAREIVGTLALSPELCASTKVFSDYLLTLPLDQPEYQKLITSLKEHVLDAQAWAFEKGFEWCLDSTHVGGE